MREHIRMAKDYLAQIGATDIELEQPRSGHFRLSWTWRGKRYKATTSYSPRCRQYAGKAVIRDIRKLHTGAFG